MPQGNIRSFDLAFYMLQIIKFHQSTF